jgi:glycosyltransferase involved in cell wall biosynthesis
VTTTQADDRRVVLLRDGRWPAIPGVCCLRHSLLAAFTSAGVGVEEASYDPSADRAPACVSPAALVIAESFDAAQAAADATSGYRVWALAFPPEQVFLGVASEFADRVADAGWGGFITDSELARESVERAAANRRARVVVFPPIARDRPCPHCRTATAVDTAAIPDVALLAYWRRAVVEERADEPYSFAAARLRGLSARWADQDWPGWSEGASTTPMQCPDDSFATEWTAATQDDCARRLWRSMRPTTRSGAPRRALLTGFDLRFARDLAERLATRGDLRMTVDEWPVVSTGSPQTEKLVDDAQSIFAEWARPNAVWLSERKRRDQVLVVRLHRYEIDAVFPREINIDNVDAVVYIAPQFGRRIRDELGWPSEKLVYVPNFLDVDWLDRPKLPQARFVLGFVGLELIRKRFDLALDLLTEVRRHDPRFTMRVRSVMPWDNRYAWLNPQERAHVGWWSARIERDPLLRNAVIFDPPGRDMGRWYRQVGFIVSTSDEEGCHSSVAEGMASGAVPVVRPWPGAVEVYDTRWVHVGTLDAVRAILAGADASAWTAAAAEAKAEIRRTNAPDMVISAWSDLLHGDIKGARKHFAHCAGM